jgi:Tim44-like domain
MNRKLRPIINSGVRVIVITAAVWLAMLAFAPFAEALARVGGGSSYGGSGGGSGGDGGGLFYLVYMIFRLLLWLTIEYPAIGIPLDIIFVVGVGYYFLKPDKKKGQAEFCTAASTGITPMSAGGGVSSGNSQQAIASAFEQLRRFDPNFSEIIFTDFCYALYARALDARATARLDDLSPYLSAEARDSLMKRNPKGLREVRGIIVGAMQVMDVRGLANPVVQISVGFEANYTEVVAGSDGTTAEMTYYVRERWELERKREVLSPTPQQAIALHCPRCGAALQKDTTGACAFCGSKIESGEFQWYVRSIALNAREPRGPLLTSDVPEVGTDSPTIVQRNFQAVRAYFEQQNPAFSWGEFMQRARLIFDELQAAWSSLNWERARPHETDNIFQMHRYWIEAYKRQSLRNRLDDCKITSMQPVKIKEDAFYNSITLRIGAEGYDYTEDSQGRVVSGSKKNLRRWTEYWTFIRNRHAKPTHARTDLSCPNCGAPLKVNVTGICEFCGGKITSGEFDWVLSRIEQDESYTG